MVIVALVKIGIKAAELTVDIHNQIQLFMLLKGNLFINKKHCWRHAIYLECYQAGKSRKNFYKKY